MMFEDPDWRQMSAELDREAGSMIQPFDPVVDRTSDLYGIRFQSAAAMRLSDDELDGLIETLRRLDDDAWSPAVSLFVMWLPNLLLRERNRRRDADSQARAEANGGHLARVFHDEPNWVFDCNCMTDDDPDSLHPSRESAMAELSAHLFEHGLTVAAIDRVEEPQEV